jgi:hypothetical protein
LWPSCRNCLFRKANLSRISEEGEGSIELVEYSHKAKSSPDHQVCMASLCNADDEEVYGGSNSTKALYIPVALESAPLTWLESLKPNSIDSWEDLKRAFIDNFQGSTMPDAPEVTAYALRVCQPLQVTQRSTASSRWKVEGLGGGRGR